MAYYFANSGGCNDITFKGVEATEDEVVITIENSNVTEECMCPLILKTRRFLYAIERTGGIPRFEETTVELPCGG